MSNISITYTNLFKKELKAAIKRGKDSKKLYIMLDLLINNFNKGIEHYSLLPVQYKLHKLKNQKSNNIWECHIEPDWLLILYLDNEHITLERTGTHSDIFNKIKR